MIKHKVNRKLGLFKKLDSLDKNFIKNMIIGRLKKTRNEKFKMIDLDPKGKARHCDNI
jgi:hypothetical protein